MLIPVLCILKWKYHIFSQKSPWSFLKKCCVIGRFLYFHCPSVCWNKWLFYVRKLKMCAEKKSGGSENLNLLDVCVEENCKTKTFVTGITFEALARAKANRKSSTLSKQSAPGHGALPVCQHQRTYEGKTFGRTKIRDKLAKLWLVRPNKVNNMFPRYFWVENGAGVSFLFVRACTYDFIARDILEILGNFTG